MKTFTLCQEKNVEDSVRYKKFGKKLQVICLACLLVTKEGLFLRAHQSLPKGSAENAHLGKADYIANLLRRATDSCA